MTITITLPNPALKQRASAAKTSVKARVETARYERKIRKSQKKIGPYIPVSYTTVYA
jgi:hypothetical protein